MVVTSIMATMVFMVIMVMGVIMGVIMDIIIIMATTTTATRDLIRMGWVRDTMEEDMVEILSHHQGPLVTLLIT